MNTNDLEPEFNKKIKAQNYARKSHVSGVILLKLNYISSEDGYFIELARLRKNKSLEAMPSFKVEQISCSSLDPKAIKAWHIHYKQDDIWFVPPHQKLLVGLHDLRKNSPTRGNTQRIVLGNHQGNLLLIPKGVAHGCVNLSASQAIIIYIANKKFNRKRPDEQRLPWDYLGKTFWRVKID